MKSILLLFLIPVIAHSQVPVKDGKGFYEVIDSSVKGTTQQLQVKAKMWMANAFKDSKEVIQLDDKDAGEVLGKGNFLLGAWGARCRFTIKISTRDNKYRCQVYDMSIHAERGGGVQSMEYYIEHPRGLGSRKILEKTDEGVKDLLAGLNADMQKGNDTF